MPLAVFTDAMDDLAATLGETATYTPGDGGAAVSGVRVNLEDEVEGQPDGFGGAAWTSVRTVECLLDELGQAPVDGDTFTIGTTVWTVGRIVENDGVFVKCAVKET